MAAIYTSAITDFGNAPNFIVYVLAKDMGVNVASFFCYRLRRGAILIPIFQLVTVVFWAKG